MSLDAWRSGGGWDRYRSSPIGNGGTGAKKGENDPVGSAFTGVMAFLFMITWGPTYLICKLFGSGWATTGDAYLLFGLVALLGAGAVYAMVLNDAIDAGMNVIDHWKNKRD